MSMDNCDAKTMIQLLLRAFLSEMSTLDASLLVQKDSVEKSN